MQGMLLQQQQRQQLTSFDFWKSPDSLEFGHGSHACPGRFFAMNVIKSTLIPLLLDYDLRLPDGEGNSVPKYNRILVLTPDRERVVQLRKRRGGG